MVLVALEGPEQLQSAYACVRIVERASGIQAALGVDRDGRGAAVLGVVVATSAVDPKDERAYGKHSATRLAIFRAYHKLKLMLPGRVFSYRLAKSFLEKGTE
jgi:hypothetical protein